MDNALSCGRQTASLPFSNILDDEGWECKFEESSEWWSWECYFEKCHSVAEAKKATFSLMSPVKSLKHPSKQKLLVSQAIPMGDSGELRTFQKWMLHSILCHLQVTYEILRLCIIQWYNRCMEILEKRNLYKSIAIRTSRSQYDHLWCSWKKSGKTGRLTYSQSYIWHWLGPASTITTTWNIQQ